MTVKETNANCICIRVRVIVVGSGGGTWRRNTKKEREKNAKAIAKITAENYMNNFFPLSHPPPPPLPPRHLRCAFALLWSFECSVATNIMFLFFASLVRATTTHSHSHIQSMCSLYSLTIVFVCSFVLLAIVPCTYDGMTCRHTHRETAWNSKRT